jgi:predicted dehydrogenase
MSPFSRREFLERSAILSAAAAALGPIDLSEARAAQDDAAKRAGSANDKLRVAVIGLNGRGMSHVGGFAGKNNCVVTTVCDCDEDDKIVGKAMKGVEKGQGTLPKYVKDVRKVVEDKDVDILAIATPNHWHALMAIWGIQNGKDVYVEKPVSHNVWEGKQIALAAKKFNKICQYGAQSRSNPGMRQSIEHVRSGKIGDVTLSIGLCYKPRPSIGDVGRKDGAQKPPATMDYDLWCGPAKVIMPTRNNPSGNNRNGPVHYDWHWIWEYGNGDLGNQGIHEMDKARWGLGKMELPASVVSAGGRFGYIDDGETANTQLSLFDYGNSHLIFEVRGLPTRDYKGAKVGNIFVGSDGMVVCPSYQSGIVYDKAGKEVKRFNGGGDQHHFDNFVKAVRSRKAEELNGHILDGHLSSALCHLGNISYRLGAEAPFNADTAAFTGCKDAVEMYTAMKDHLKENKVELAKAVGRIGPKLTIDPKTEQFTGSEAAKANPMLTREYRKGFEVKDQGAV